MKKTDTYPPIETLIPHKGANVFLESVIEKNADSIQCLGFWPDEKKLGLTLTGAVHSLTLEIASQGVAAFAGLEVIGKGGVASKGYLISLRSVVIFPLKLALREALIVKCKQIWRDVEFGIFDCQIHVRRSNKLLFKGTLSFFKPLTENNNE